MVRTQDRMASSLPENKAARLRLGKCSASSQLTVLFLEYLADPTIWSIVGAKDNEPRHFDERARATISCNDWGIHDMLLHEASAGVKVSRLIQARHVVQKPCLEQ